jgi:mono/diheme cytochrome c family protein
MTATLRWPILFGFALACSLAPGGIFAQPVPQVNSSALSVVATVDDLARGAVFLAQCGHCHGPRAGAGAHSGPAPAPTPP